MNQWPTPPDAGPPDRGSPARRRHDPLRASRRDAVTAYVLIILLSSEDHRAAAPHAAVPVPIDVASFMWDELREDTLTAASVYEAVTTSLGRLLAGFTLAILVGWS